MNDHLAEQQGSDESGEGLDVVTVFDNGMGLVWSCTCRATGAGASVLVRKAARNHGRQHAEAALVTARRDADELRGERDALRDRAATLMRQIGVSRDVVRAELEGAPMTAACGAASEHENMHRLEHLRRCPICDLRFDRADHLRAALANPSAAQGEGEVGARVLREAAEALNTEDAATDVALLGVDYVIQRLLDRADSLATDAPEASR